MSGDHNDERETLAVLIESVGVYVPGSHGHDYINPAKAADAILAAGFRRQGSITDEWEYEYADDDDPEGNVYGRVRRIVGPWEPVEDAGGDL